MGELCDGQRASERCDRSHPARSYALHGRRATRPHQSSFAGSVVIGIRPFGFASSQAERTVGANAARGLVATHVQTAGLCTRFRSDGSCLVISDDQRRRLVRPPADPFLRTTAERPQPSCDGRTREIRINRSGSTAVGKTTARVEPGFLGITNRRASVWIDVPAVVVTPRRVGAEQPAGSIRLAASVLTRRAAHLPPALGRIEVSAVVSAPLRVRAGRRNTTALGSEQTARVVTATGMVRIALRPGADSRGNDAAVVDASLRVGTGSSAGDVSVPALVDARGESFACPHDAGPARSLTVAYSSRWARAAHAAATVSATCRVIARRHARGCLRLASAPDQRDGTSESRRS